MASLRHTSGSPMGGLAGLAWAGLLLALALAGACRGEAETAHLEPDIVALGRQVMVTLPPAPAYALGASGGLWSVDEISAQVARITDHAPTINSNALSFVRPEHRWLVSFNAWFMQLQKALKIKYKDGTFECGDFARCYVAFANMVALSGGERRGSICVAWGTVGNARDFGGVSGGSVGGHAVVIVGTSEGLFVVEPQTGVMAPMREYPNRDTFEELNF